MLREVRLAHRTRAPLSEFPFTVPAVRTLDVLRFDAPVTFFVGENGSGKSTLLEGIAAAVGLPAIGSAEVALDGSLAPARALAAALRLSWDRRTNHGFFLRAEDFFGFAKRLQRERAELLREIAATEEEYRARDRAPHALGLALGPLLASLGDMERRYGIDLDAQSHGQSFLRVFENRLVPRGLYLLDEPEAALSPQSQLGLLAMMLDLVRKGAQFIVATHAPILLGYPGARHYSFDVAPAAIVPFAELEHVRLTQAFLADPEAYLRHLV